MIIYCTLKLIASEKVEKIISSGHKYVTLSRRGKLIVAKIIYAKVKYSVGESGENN